MGKDLKGKELGVGICQTKDKKYVARITTRNGKRVKRVFDKLIDCKKWIAEARYNEEHGSISVLSDMSVDAWYESWITEIKVKTVRFNTIRNHNERYKQNIKEYIGHMPLNKTLQMILGHSNIGITMNLYVHVTDEEKVKELSNIEDMLKFGT